MAILEPQAPDSMAAWGAFNNSFEQKEYSRKPTWPKSRRG